MKRCCRTCKYWMGKPVVRRRWCEWFAITDVALPSWLRPYRMRLCLPTYGTICKAWEQKEETK